MIKCNYSESCEYMKADFASSPQRGEAVNVALNSYLASQKGKVYYVSSKV